MNRHRWLTNRERDVLDCMMRGLTAEQIASEQYVTVATARTHIRNILIKLGAKSQLHAVALTMAAMFDDAERAMALDRVLAS